MRIAVAPIVIGIPERKLTIMSQKRLNQKTFTPLGTVIEKIVRQYRPHTEQSLMQVWNIWQEAVGSEIAANARPAAFKGHLLLIHVTNSTWMHHLRFQEKNLIEKLNQALGAAYVRMVKFKIGPI
jgi:predicted nucleic acid-binding Zn ribbon protein